MSYYFAIVGTKDNPVFELEFGTSKAGGDGVSRFREEARHMNQFIIHASLDMVEQVQWLNNNLYVVYSVCPRLVNPSNSRVIVLNISPMCTHHTTNTKVQSYLKSVDRFQNNHIFCFLTGGGVKFLLLMNADPAATSYASFAPSGSAMSKQPTNSARQTALLAANPTSAQTEDAVKAFMAEVYELWIKHILNPLFVANKTVSSPSFRATVAAAAKRYL